MDLLPDHSPRPLKLRKPALPGTLVLKEDPGMVLDALAADLFIQASNCVRAFGDFHLALSVFPNSEPLLRQLMFDPALRELPWKRTHLWLLDEELANAPAGSRGPLGSTLFDLVVEPSDIPSDQVHLIAADAPAPERAFEKRLQDTLGWREKGHDRLDFVLLSPEHWIAGGLPQAPDQLVARHGPRVSMTHRLVSASRFLAVLAGGPSVRPTLERVHRGEAGGVIPMGGELRWYLDPPACPTYVPPPTTGPANPGALPA
jgi:hypothetical protein